MPTRSDSPSILHSFNNENSTDASVQINVLVEVDDHKGSVLRLGLTLPCGRMADVKISLRADDRPDVNGNSQTEYVTEWAEPKCALKAS